MEEVSKEARYEKNAVAHRYTQLDKLYREMFRRAFSKALHEGEAEHKGKDAARAMFKRCVDRGVDKAFMYEWPKHVKVSATRAIGMGSVGVKFDITNQLMQISEKFDEIGKREALRDWVAARVGYRNADKYVQRMDRDQIAANESSISALEWNDIVEGSQVIVGHDQVHKMHIDVFLPRMAQIIQAFEQGQTQDPARDYRTLALAHEHIMGHLQFLAQDKQRKAYVDQVGEFLKVVEQAAQQLQKIAQRMAESQQQQARQQQQLVAEADQIKRDREIELKVFEAQKKYELEMMKQNSLNEARRLKTDEQLGISRHKASESIRLQAEKQAAELDIARQKAMAEADIKRARP